MCVCVCVLCVYVHVEDASWVMGNSTGKFCHLLGCLVCDLSVKFCLSGLSGISDRMGVW